MKNDKAKGVRINIKRDLYDDPRKYDWMEGIEKGENRWKLCGKECGKQEVISDMLFKICLKWNQCQKKKNKQEQKKT
jgi:hypothetical protein